MYIYISASRGAIAASILLGYPITFEGFRGAFLELIKNKAPTQQVKDLIAVGFLFACGGSAMLLRDLGAGTFIELHTLIAPSLRLNALIAALWSLNRALIEPLVACVDAAMLLLLRLC
jgi:hypothetical protein